ncbi:MAG: cell division protein FtsL [Chromatiales bacterium]|nr:cell division protein FtsL [Chromatiales bacterium]
MATFAGVLAVGVVASGIGNAYLRHETRKLYTGIQALRVERSQLELEWGQLQIEQSTRSTHERIEREARKGLGMRNPTVADQVILELE